MELERDGAIGRVAVLMGVNTRVTSEGATEAKDKSS